MLEFEYSTRGRETVPMKYSPERREAILAKLEAPYNRTVNDLAAEEGISTATIYNWRKQAFLFLSSGGGGLPVMRKQFFDPAVRVRGQPCQDVFQIRMRI